MQIQQSIWRLEPNYNILDAARPPSGLDGRPHNGAFSVTTSYPRSLLFIVHRLLGQGLLFSNISDASFCFRSDGVMHLVTTCRMDVSLAV
jgi:hypothetical protein